MSRRRVFVGAEQLGLLDKAEGWRKECIRVLSRAPINSPLYRSVSGIMDAIDGLAEAVTGNRQHFHLQAPRTPGTKLPGMKPPE
jgi:hypothetical protein